MKSGIFDVGDLEAAFEAVKGVLFGPLDAATVKHKFNEIVREKKQERDLESNPMSLLGHGREEAKEREYRSRNDRELQRLMVLSLLNAGQQQRLAAIYDGMDGSRGKGAEAGKRLAELENKLKRWHEKIMANAVRDPQTGKALFKFEDGRVMDEDGHDVSAERVAGLDFTGKTRGQEKLAYDATRAEVDDMQRGLSNALGELDTLEADLNGRIAENPDKADEAMADAELRQQDIDKRIDDIGTRVREIQQGTELSRAPAVENEVKVDVEVVKSQISVFKLP